MSVPAPLVLQASQGMTQVGLNGSSHMQWVALHGRRGTVDLEIHHFIASGKQAYSLSGANIT